VVLREQGKKSPPIQTHVPKLIAHSRVRNTIMRIGTIYVGCTI